MIGDVFESLNHGTFFWDLSMIGFYFEALFSHTVRINKTKKHFFMGVTKNTEQTQIFDKTIIHNTRKLH